MQTIKKVYNYDCLSHRYEVFRPWPKASRAWVLSPKDTKRSALLGEISKVLATSDEEKVLGNNSFSLKRGTGRGGKFNFGTVILILIG